MVDLEIIILCALKEADGEPDDGIAAVARVAKNRMRLKYESDGTPAGTVERRDQFSWVNWDYVDGHYKQVAVTPEQVSARVADLLAKAKANTVEWSRVSRIVQAVFDGTYAGQDYAHLTDETVLYVNLAIDRPYWAKPDTFVCKIGHHSFYRA